MDSSSDFEQVVNKLINADTPPIGGGVDQSQIPPLNSEILLTDNGKEIFNRRYRRKDPDGNYTESIQETYMRIAQAIAAGEESVDANQYYTNVFFNLLTQLKFIPNAPTWTGAGTPLGQLAACFVLPIEDDMGRVADGIFTTLRNAALIQQTGGGNGFSFSRLRPQGDVVSKSMGKATGPVGFLEVFDAAFEEIAQGGIRRGANMAVLRVDHPDILRFIRCKTKEGKVRNFNISVAVTDEFMQAVANDEEYSLINPRDKQVWQTIPARTIFEQIVDNAWRNGEPGLLFIDEANRYNPVPDQYELEATNPCGEQWLGPYENCCLGHINLVQHITNREVDWQALAQTVHHSVRFLDDVVTVNGYVPEVPQLQEAAAYNRRIGLGFTGLADTFYILGVRYGDEQSAEIAAQITEFMRYHAILASINLAKERTPFPGISESIYNPDNFSWETPRPLLPYALDIGRPTLDWQQTKELLRQFGIRNSAQMTIAPTGSTSTVLGVEGYGCEPVFALAYERNVYQAAGEKEKMTLTYTSPLFTKALGQTGLDEIQQRSVIDEIKQSGTCQYTKLLPPEVRDKFVVAQDIAPAEHVLMQSSIQAFIDNSISKTCNFPQTATSKDIEAVYFQAWEQKCRGITVYRTGSRQEIVLETAATKKQAQADEISTSYVVRPREKYLDGITQKVATPMGNMYLTVNTTEAGDFHEVFINLGKAGSDVRADTEALGRLISLIFRLGAANSNQRMQAIIHELDGISSGMVTGFNGERVLSIPDAIAKGLKRVVNPELFDQQTVLNLFADDHDQSPNPSLPQGQAEMCPICGNFSVMQIEGCKKCSVQVGGCGEYSAC